MTRIEKKFAELKKDNKKAFIAYITCGHPSLNKTEEIVNGLESAGVDILELGVPFSDPMADGPVIQHSSDVGVKNGVSLNDVLLLIKKIRIKSQIPIVIFSYYNPIHKMGVQKFVRQAKDYGADGVLITDLTPESSYEYKKIADKAGLNTIFLAAPTTPNERLKKVIKLTSGFLYYISTTGVTGARKEMDSSIASKVKNIKKLTTLPIAVGFGVSKPQHVKDLSKFADGIIVGSAIVKNIQGNNGDVNKLFSYVSELTKSLK